MRKRISILAILTIALAGFSCEEMIEIDPPLNQTVAENVFRSESTALAALSGLYSSFSQSQTQLQSLTLSTGLAADELVYNQLVPTSEELVTNTYRYDNSTFGTFFSEYYAAIYKANSIIEGSAASTLPEALKVRLTSEAKFIRAYCYFYLVTLFDAVPLVLVTDVNVTAMLPRTSATLVYDQIVRDLTEAREGLQEDYAVSADERTVPNKYAVSALLARVYLFRGDYAQAESFASDVIGHSELYTLVPSENIAHGVFARSNSEAVLQFMGWMNSTYLYTAEASAFIPSVWATTASYEIRPSLLASFEAGDLRRTAWINDLAMGGTTWEIPYKYKNTSSVTVVAEGEYPTVLRLAEQYLIRAEARARRGNDLSGALGDLNVIRTRAGLSESTTTDAATLVTEVLEEKRKELFLELGHRWLDLRRTGTIDAVLGAEKETWTPTAALFPIPQNAIDRNPALSPNNPGY